MAQYTIYSATGCHRCKVAKDFMTGRGIEFDEVDIKTEAKNEFNKFYRANRPVIHRGEEGIEFPILSDGQMVKQGVGVILAWLAAGEDLDDFISRSDLLHGWISGISLSGGPAEKAGELITVLEQLKKHGIQIQIDTDGGNPELLEQVIDKGLADKVVFRLLGPAQLYEPITGRKLSREDLERSLASAAKAPEYRIFGVVSYLTRPDGEKGWLTPQEMAQAAASVEQATGSKKQPFFIKAGKPPQDSEVEPLDQAALFKYRTQARRHMVLADIEK